MKAEQQHMQGPPGNNSDVAANNCGELKLRPINHSIEAELNALLEKVTRLESLVDLKDARISQLEAENANLTREIEALRH
jgi:peptidoglycan hydrolase CwlO-like protein